MSKFCLALAAGALLAASPAAAQSPVTTYPATSAPVFSSPAYGSQVYSSPAVVTSSEPAVRRGLFARIRARREARSMPATAATYGPVMRSPVYTSGVYGAPTMTTPGTIITTPSSTPTAPPPSAPMQMPGRTSMMMPAGMQSVVVNGMAYSVPATLPPEGVVVSERIVTPGYGSMVMPASGTVVTTPGQIQNLTFYYSNPASGVVPASGTVVTPGTVTPATFSIPLRPMPR